MNILRFFLRYKFISRNHETLGRWYFRAYFLAPLFFIFGVIFAYLANSPSENQENFLLAFYGCIAIGILFIGLMILIELYAFLAWIKRNIL